MWNVVSMRSFTHSRSCDGTPRSSQMTIDGRVAPKSATKSKSSLDPWIEEQRGQLTDVALELGHPPRRERPRRERPESRVVGGIPEDHHPGRHRLVVHDLEDRSVARHERRRVAVRSLDVRVTRERPEVEPLVAVQRRLVADAAPDSVRVGVEVDVERIPIQVVDCSQDGLQPAEQAFNGTYSAPAPRVDLAQVHLV